MNSRRERSGLGSTGCMVAFISDVMEQAVGPLVPVIGRAGLADLSPALRKAEERLGREVNVAVYSPEEFQEKIKSRDHFLTAVLRGRKQFVKGSQSGLDEIIGK